VLRYCSDTLLDRSTLRGMIRKATYVPVRHVETRHENDKEFGMLGVSQRQRTARNSPGRKKRHV